jgi:manganese/zinc/iron transport system permease protein
MAGRWISWRRKVIKMDGTSFDVFRVIQLIFTDYTIRTVALGALVLGIVSGTLSAFAVLRKQSLLGDVMSHAALPGVVLVFILTGLKDSLPLMIGAAVAGWLGTLLMSTITTRTRIKEDSAMGIVLAVFFGVGIALLSWVGRQGNASQAGLNKFLFGSAAATVERDVMTMALVGAVALIAVLLMWKEFKLLSFDPGYAAALGFNVRALDITLTTLIVIAVVVGLQTVGVVLMSAMLVAPGAAARQWTNSLGKMVILSAFFGATAGVIGALISSLTTNLPTGPVIVLTISAIVLFSLLFAPQRGILWDQIRQTGVVLEALYEMGLHHDDPAHPHSLKSLQAGLPRCDVPLTLKKLAEDGMAQEGAGNQWALTPTGVEWVETTLKHHAPESETATETEAAR